MIPAPKGALPAWPRQRGSPRPSDPAVDGLDRATHSHFAENPRILAKLTCSPPASSPCFVWRHPPRRAGPPFLPAPGAAPTFLPARHIDTCVEGHASGVDGKGEGGRREAAATTGLPPPATAPPFSPRRAPGAGPPLPRAGGDR